MRKNIGLKTACDNNCIFCRDTKYKYHRDWNNYDDIALLKSEVASAAREGYTEVKFFGSEPLNHPDILQLIEYARLCNIKHIAINTTGRKLKDTVFLKKLVMAGVTTFRLPIYGSNRKYHDSVTGTSGSFSDLMQALDNLSKLNVGVYLTCLVLRSNYKNIALLTKFIIEKYPSMYFGFNQVKPFSNSFIEYKKAVPSYRQSSESLKMALRIYKSKRPSSNKGIDDFYMKILSFPPCIVFKMDKDLLLLPFVSRAINRKEHKSSDEGFLYANRYKISACKKCMYDKRCTGVYKLYLKAYGVGEFKPVLRRNLY